LDRLVDAAVDKTEAGNLQLDYSDANSSVATGRPITRPQREDAVDAGSDHRFGTGAP
jgi:hypothetical protein